MRRFTSSFASEAKSVFSPVGLVRGVEPSSFAMAR
jgi:hypothetical protein